MLRWGMSKNSGAMTHQEIAVLSAINRGAKALSAVSASDIQSYRGPDELGVLCWIMRQYQSEKPPFVCKLLQIAIDKGAPIDGPPKSRFTPFVHALQADRLALALWLFEHGASSKLSRQNQFSPLESLVYRLSQVGWRQGFYLKHDRANSIALAKGMIERGADPFGDCLDASCPVEHMVKRLRLISQVDTANAFMDVFWRAGCEWKQEWNQYVEEAGPKWKGLPMRADTLRTEKAADQLEEATPEVSTRPRARSRL